MPASSAMLRPRELGFALTLRHGGRSLRQAIVLGLVFGLWMAIADTWLFSGVVPRGQHVMLASMSALARIAWHTRVALFDEALYRLVLLTSLAWLIARYTGWRDGRAVWPAILLVALALYPLGRLDYFAALDWSWSTVVRELLLHGGAGVLWGWLYWRHGWLAGVAGNVAAQLSLQPLLSAWS